MSQGATKAPGSSRKSELAGVCKKKMPKLPIVPKIEQIPDEEKIPGSYSFKLAAVSHKEGEKDHILHVCAHVWVSTRTCEPVVASRCSPFGVAVANEGNVLTCTD